MGVFCWGELAKSANDTTTIAQYIAAKILEHNISPQAHGLQDYALYNHRTDEIIDHRDYSIIGEKITADKIIGKHFATDSNVGASQDGIEFDRNAISMWNDGQKKVYIPKTGNPSFQGTLKIQELSYFQAYLQTFFETPGLFGSKYGTINNQFGQITLNLQAGSGKFSYFYANCNFPNPNQGLLWESRLNVTDSAATWYWGMGQNWLDAQEGAQFGFASVGFKTYAFVQKEGNFYFRSISNHSPGIVYKYRAELSSDLQSVKFLINDEERATINGVGNIEIAAIQFSVQGFNASAFSKYLQAFYLVMGENNL